MLNIELSKKPKLPHHFSQININSILPSTKSFAREMMSCINTPWILTRSLPTLTTEIPVQKVPGWTGFHVLISTNTNDPTIIGYCQEIPAPPTDANVVLTMLSNVDEMLTTISQRNPILTLDEGIYEIVKKIQFQSSPRFDHMVIRLGGFHQAKNFVGVIGKRMDGSGFGEILQDALWGDTSSGR